MTTTAPAVVVLPTSYLTLDADHPHVRAALLDANRMHQLIMSGWQHAAFPGEPARATLDILYALSPTTTGAVRVVTQAAVAPHWQLPDNMLTASTTDRHAPLHGTIAFQLTAAPTKSLPGTPIAPGKHSRGRKIPLPVDQRHAWGERVLRSAGLNVVDLHTTTIGRLHSPTKSLPPDQRPAPTSVFTHTTVTYTGIATIADPTRHRHALTHGIGPGKAYGCGLLLTRRYNKK